MMKFNRLPVFTGMAIAIALTLAACSQVKPGKLAESDQISVEYVYPEDPDHQKIYEELKKRRSLERLDEFLSPFILQWPLTISLDACDGEADASYELDEIIICYEYIEELVSFMPDETTPAGIEPIDTVIGPFVDTVLHEFAHSLFDTLDIPILGREEDAADQVAAFTYLQMGKTEARRLIMGTVYAYMLEVQDTDAPTMEEYADEHSTSEQRAFNLMCIAYGADPDLFEDVVRMGGLPEDRIEICEEEYELIAHAYYTLIGPHIDPILAREVFDKSWLPEAESDMLKN